MEKKNTGSWQTHWFIDSFHEDESAYSITSSISCDQTPVKFTRSLQRPLMSFHSFEPRNYLRTDPEKEYMKKILEMPQTHQKYITLIYELIKKNSLFLFCPVSYHLRVIFLKASRKTIAKLLTALILSRRHWSK